MVVFCENLIVLLKNAVLLDIHCSNGMGSCGLLGLNTKKNEKKLFQFFRMGVSRKVMWPMGLTGNLILRMVGLNSN